MSRLVQLPGYIGSLANLCLFHKLNHIIRKDNLGAAIRPEAIELNRPDTPVLEPNGQLQADHPCYQVQENSRM